MALARGRIIRAAAPLASQAGDQPDEQPTRSTSVDDAVDPDAKAAAMFLALRKAEEESIEARIDRCQAVAVALAERILCEALECKPERILTLARQALAEARGARQVHMEAHPDDVAILAHHLAEFGLPAGCITIQAAPHLQRGDVCLHTDLGTLDAKLTPQLERLARALRDIFR